MFKTRDKVQHITSGYFEVPLWQADDLRDLALKVVEENEHLKKEWEFWSARDVEQGKTIDRYRKALEIIDKDLQGYEYKTWPSISADTAREALNSQGKEG